MPVLHDSKLIFIHIPKTGGTTVEKMLISAQTEKFHLWGRIQTIDDYRKLFPGRPDISRENPDRTTGQKMQQLHHLTANDIHITVGSDKWNSYNKFTIIRSPWDRLVSMYEYGRANKLMGVGSLSFKDWFYVRPVTPRLIPWITVDTAVDESITFLNFEDFPGNLKKYFIDIGFDIQKFDWSVHEKKSTREPLRSYYDSEMMAIIANECKDDIEYFGFKKPTHNF